MSYFSKNVLLFTVTVVTTVAGQALRSTSGDLQSCQEAIATLVNDAEASQCLALPQLSQIFSADPQFSVVGAVDTWLKAMCTTKPCSGRVADRIANSSAAVKNCALLPQDLDDYNIGYGGQLCFKDQSVNTLCTTQFLANYEAVYGTITSPVVQAIINVDLVSLPAELLCTNCTKALFTYQVSILDMPEKKAYIGKASQICGPQFVDGKGPPSIFDLQPAIE